MAEKIGQFITPGEAMRLAIEEAKQGLGFVAPNPPVGCVIVDKDHKLLATGYHHEFGKAHAEIDALSQIKDQALLKSATVFVTLEPCSHFGKTPPCAQALAKLPIERVVYGLQDPNPKVSGQGAKCLRDAGIAVQDWKEFAGEEGLELGADLEELAEVFLFNQRHLMPFVAVKIASSLDGKMALSSGESKWITGEEARVKSHYLRSQYDAVLIGRNTLLADDPALNVRLQRFAGKRNHAIVLDPLAQTATDIEKSQLLKVRPPEKVWIVVDSKLVKSASDFPMGVNLVGVDLDSSGNFQSEALLIKLWERGIRSLFVEGGAQTIAAFFQTKRVQRLHLFLAPCLIGGKHGLSWSQHFGEPTMTERLELGELNPERVGNDLYFNLKI